jgi:lipoprotein LprG
MRDDFRRSLLGFLAFDICAAVNRSHRLLQFFTVIRRVLASFLAVGFLSACSHSTPVLLPPAEIVMRAAQRTRALSSFHFLINRSGAPAYLDNEETISFRRADGDFLSAGSTHATVRVITPGMVAEIQIISTPDGYWETNLLTGEWQSLPPDQGFNPAVLFDPQIGFQPIIESDLADLKWSGSDELDTLPGKDLYHLSGSLDGKRLYEMSYGMIGPKKVSVELWVAPESFEIIRILITEPPEEAEEATLWQIDFSEFNQIIEITPPVLNK